MDTRPIADGIAVAGQIALSDVEAIADLGFRTLISNRPDTEPGTVPHNEIRAAAEKAGMAFHYVPVELTGITEANVRDMSAAMERAERPVLAYCRSGGRCANLLQLTSAAR